MDSTTYVDELKHKVRKFCDDRDWQQFHTPKNLSMAIAAEAGELLEQFLWVDGPASAEKLHNDSKRSEVIAELADIIIYCVRFADVAGVDISDAIRDKLNVNSEKYPVSLSRGNATKYTEL